MQVGEQYEIVDEELDPESAMLVNLARKKYEVRKMLDGSTSKMVKVEDSQEER